MSVPMEEVEQMPPEGMPPEDGGMPPGPQMLSDQDEKDIDIIIALALQMLEGTEEGMPDAEEVLSKIMASAKPESQVAMFFTQLIEALMTDPNVVELGVNPAIIMAQGGVIDELTDELNEMLGQDISGIVEAAKPIIMQNVQKRAGQFAQEGQQGAPPVEGPPAPQEPRPVMAGV